LFVAGIRKISNYELLKKWSNVPKLNFAPFFLLRLAFRLCRLLTKKSVSEIDNQAERGGGKDR
jgi:hypothetical protein